ncbi:hypothetical protein ABPG72_021435 [Tetrahymena utriculariae]
MSINDLVNDHSQQGILLKLQYSEDAKQLKFRNEIISDRIIWELPVLQEQKPQNKTKIDANLAQLESQNIFCRQQNQENTKQNYDDINTSYLFQKINISQNLQNNLTDQIEVLSPTNNQCQTYIDQQNQKSFYNKSQYNYIKKEKLRRQPQIDKQSNKRSFHYNLIFLTKMKKLALKFFHHYTISGRTVYLTNQIRQRINDKSDFIQQGNEKFTVINFVVKQINVLLYRFPSINIPLINPQSNFGFMIQIFFITFNWIFFYLFSLGVIFNEGLMVFLNLFVIGIAVWLIEILLKMNTLIYNYTQIVKKRKQIMLIYLKQKSIYDLIPILFLYVLHIYKDQISLILNIILSTLICLKFKNISQDINQIQTQFCKRIKRYYFIQMFNLIFKIFMIAHTIACLWYLIGLYEKQVLNIQTWFDQMFQQTNIWWQLYIYSFYWALQLMVMGSNTANSITQISFTIFVTFITVIVFGYILNIIGMILEELDSNEISKRYDINVINEYMRQKNISMDLQTQINLDLNYFYEKNIKKIQQDVENAVSNLSSEMRMKLKLEQNLQILKNISFFEKNFSKQSLLEFASSLEEFAYYPNQTIFQNDKSEDSIILIDSGKVEVTKQCKNSSSDSYYSQIFLDGQYFGQYNFFTGNASELHCVSKEFTKIVKLNRQKFITIIQNCERDYETFCQIRDNIQFYDNLKELGDKCSTCSNRWHSSLKCPRAHFDKFSVFQKLGILQSKLQSRSGKQRRKYKLNSLNINNHISYTAVEYLNSLQCKYLDSASKAETKISEEDFSLRLSEQNSQNVIHIHRGEQKQEDFTQTEQIKANLIQKMKLYTQPSIESQLFLSQQSYDKGLDEQIQQTKIQNSSRCTKQFSRQSNQTEENSIIEIERSKKEIQEGVSKVEDNCNEEQNLNKNKEQPNQKLTNLHHKFKKKISSQNLDQKFVQFFDYNGGQYEQKEVNMLSPYQFQQNTLSNSFTWNFEMQKDYKFYFAYGNLKYQLIRIQKAQIKNLKQKLLKKKII